MSQLEVYCGNLDEINEGSEVLAMLYDGNVDGYVGAAFRDIDDLNLSAYDVAQKFIDTGVEPTSENCRSFQAQLEFSAEEDEDSDDDDDDVEDEEISLREKLSNFLNRESVDVVCRLQRKDLYLLLSAALEYTEGEGGRPDIDTVILEVSDL